MKRDFPRVSAVCRNYDMIFKLTGSEEIPACTANINCNMPYLLSLTISIPKQNVGCQKIAEDCHTVFVNNDSLSGPFSFAISKLSSF